MALVLVSILAGTMLSGCTEDAGEGDELPDGDEEDPVDDDAQAPENDGSQAGDDEEGDEEQTPDEPDEPPEELNVETPDAWPTLGFDAARSGSFASSGGGTGQELWTVGIDAEVHGQGAIADGHVFLSLEDFSEQTFVRAYDANTGEEAWSFETDDVVSSPLVVSDGLVFASTEARHLFALDTQDGEVEWDLEGGSDVVRMTIDAGTLYVPASNTLTAIDASTGEVDWSLELEGFGDTFRGHPVVHEGLIFVGADTDEGDLYAIDADTNETEWVYDTGEEFWSVNTPSLANGLIFVGLPDADEIHAVHADSGEEAWVQEVSHGSSSLVLHDEKVFSYDRENRDAVVRALHQDSGEEAWNAGFFLGAEGGHLRALAAAGSSLYAGSGDGSVLALDPGTGEEDWRVEELTRAHLIGAVGDVIYFAGASVEGDAASQLHAIDAGYT